MTAEPTLPLDEVVARKVQAKRKVGFMTAAFYLGEMLVGSLLAIVLLVTSHLRMSADAALFAAGIVAWTFAEYLVHRFVLHDLIPTQHGLHHAHPDAPVLTIFWQIWLCFALVYLIAGGAFLAGALVAYSWYLFVHHCASTTANLNDAQHETSASAPPFGITCSERCCASDPGPAIHAF